MIQSLLTKVFLKKSLSFLLSFTMLVWSFGVPLGVLFTPSTAQAVSSVVIDSGNNNNFPGAPIPASSPASAVAKVSVTASDAAETLQAVTVNFSGTGFATSDLATIATDATSGVALYDDTGGTVGSFDGTDSVITLAASPAFSGNNITLTPASAAALADSGATVFHVVIKTSATIANGDQIIATIPAGASGVVTSLGNGPTTQFSTNMLVVDTVVATITSIEGFAGQDTVTVRFSTPVQKVGGGNLAVGDTPFTLVDNGTTGGSSITAVAHSAGQDFATLTLSDNLDAGDFDGTPSTLAAGSNKIASMAGNALGTTAVSFGSSLSITTAVVPSTTVATVFNSGSPLVTFAAAGGTTPYTFAPSTAGDTTELTSLGLTLATDGKLTGTIANVPGSHNVTVKVTDSAGTPVVVTKPFTINIAPSGGGEIPGLSGVVPAGGPQSATNLSVTITGVNTNFTASSVVSFSFPPGDSGTNGITPGTVVLNSTTSITVPITIAAGATVGARDVKVTTGTEVATMPFGFDVFASGASGLTLQSPANTGTNVPIPPSFTFNPSSDTTINSYRVTVNAASNFSGTTLWDYVFPKPADAQNTNASNCSASTCNVPFGAGTFRIVTQPAQLAPNTAYYWQVRTYTQTDATFNATTSIPVESTVVRSFTTVASITDTVKPSIEHRPVFQATASANLNVFARIFDNIATTTTTPALATTLYYCAGAACTPTTTATGSSVGAGYFKYTIPSATINTAGTVIRYYLSATDGTNTQTMYQTGTTPFQLSSVASAANTIAGTVKDSTGTCATAVRQATIFAEGTGFSATSSNDANCTYTLSGLFAGTYDLVAVKDGYSDRFITGIPAGSSSIAFQLSSGVTGGFGGDTTKPRVKLTLPMDEMTNMPGADTNMQVVVVFDKAMSQNAVTTSGNMTVNELDLATGTLTDITTTKGSWTYYTTVPAGTPLPPEATGNVAVWSLSGSNTLGDNKTIAVIVSANVTDTAGNAIQGNQPDGSYAFTFSTSSQTFLGSFGAGESFGSGAFILPHVRGTTPPPGSFAVPTNTKITIDFSEGMADDAGTYVLKNYVKLFTVSGTTETDVSSSAINTVTLSSNKLSAKVALKSTFNSGAFAASTAYRLKVLGGAKAANSIALTEPGSESIAVFISDFTTGATADTAAPTVLGSFPDNAATAVPVNVGAINIGFSKDMDPSTFTASTVTLKVGSTAVNGTLEYKPLERMAYFVLKGPLNSNTTYTLTLTTGVKALNGVALAATVTRSFTTGSADATAPEVSFMNADDFGIALTFSEPMNAAKATDTINWGTSVLNHAVYDVIEYGTAGFSPGAGTTVALTGTTLTYDAQSSTVIIKGLAITAAIGQELYLSMDTAGGNIPKDLSGNALNSSFAASRVTLGNSSTTKGALGPMATSTGAFSGGGDFVPTNFSGDTFGFAPAVGVFPFNMMAGQTTVYGVSVPVSKQIPAGGTIVLTFPQGFDVSAAQQDVNSPMKGDLNGPGTGTVKFKCNSTVAGGKTCSGDAADTNDEAGDTATKGGLADDGVTVNQAARTITITLSAATDVAGHDFLNFDISGIKNSTVPKDFNTAGYTVDVKTKNGATVLESLTSQSFFIQSAGTSTLSGTITATGNDQSGTMQVYLMSPMTGPLEATSADFSGGATAAYSIASLPDGEYMLFTDQSITLGSKEFAGKNTPERVVISGNTTYNFTVANNTTGGTDITISIDGPSAEKVDIFAGSQNGFKAKQVTLDSNAGAENFTINLANGTWFVGVGPQMPKGPMAGPPSAPSYVMPKPLEIKISAGPAYVETSGTANDGTLVFTLTNAGKQIKGTVKDGAGKIIANAEVYAYDPQGGFGTNGQSDAAGLFTLNVVQGSYVVGGFVQGMPASKEVSVVVTSHATDYLLISGATTAITPAVAATSFALKIAKPDYTISGKVTDGTNVVQGASVFAYRTDGPGFANANTNSSGNYTLYVANGTWKVGVFVPQYGNLNEQDVTVSGANKSSVNFAPSETGTFYAVSGQVYQDITAGGGFNGSDVAIQGAFVRIQGSTFSNETITGADGTYSFNVPAGNGYTMKAFAPGIGELPSLAAFNVAAATPNKDITVSAPNTITITLSSSVTEAFVDLFSSTGVGGNTSIRNTTAGTLSLPSGSYKVNVHIPGVAIGLTDVAATDGTTTYSNTTGIVTVNGAEGLTITLPTLRTVTGTVTDGTNNIADAWVEIFNSTTGIHTGTKSGSDGSFTLKVPDSATDYKINAMKPGFFRDATSLTVNGSNPASQTLTIASATLTISGQVLLANTGVANAFVRAEKQGGGFAGGQADASGNYSIGVTSGSWKVYAIAEGYAEAAAANNADTTGGSVSGLNITVSTAVTLKAPRSKSITPASGGTVEDTASGVKITIPANSLCSVTCTPTAAGNVQSKETNNIRSTSTARPVGGKAQEITATDSGGTAIKALDSDITIEKTLTLADVNATASATDASIDTLAEANALKMAYWDTSLENWIPQSSTVTYKDSSGTIITDDTDIDTAAEFASTVASIVVSATTSHLSLYAPISSTDPGASETPTGLAVSATGTSSITLTWTEVSGATSYDIYRSTTSGGTYTRVGSEPTVSSGSTTTFTNTQLSGNTTYFYKISSLNGSGESAASSAVSGTTTASSGGYTPPPPAPAPSPAPAPAPAPSPTPTPAATPPAATPAAPAPAPTPAPTSDLQLMPIPAVSANPTVAEIQAAITAILHNITVLQAELGKLEPTSTPALCSGVSFARGLTIGSTGSDVKCLQALLNQSTDTRIASSGVGSAGNETSYFGSLTANAVGKFQVKKSLVSGSGDAAYGYVGPQTRTQLNSLLGQ